MRKLSILTIAALTTIGTQTAQAVNWRPPTEKPPQCAGLKIQIQTLRTRTWHMQDFMGMPRTKTSYSERWTKSCVYTKWIATTWRERSLAAHKQFSRPPHYDAWMCIHRYEGSWTDPNAPYYGGLQMDEGFQRSYGYELYRSKGTADHWTPLEQMWVAERAYETRGFNPWPNTARYCHLL